MTDQPPPRNAQLCPPWRPEMGPEPCVTTWSYPRPRMLVHLDGTWRRAEVRQRYDWADGKVSYQLDVWLPSEDNPRRMTLKCDSYWWDPATMRAA